MPESPEVQALVEFVAERAVGRSILSVEIVDPRVRKTRRTEPEVPEGGRVNAVLRSGKYVDIDAGEWHIVVSFGRHGWGVWRSTDTPEAEATAAPVVARIRFGGREGALEGGGDGGGDGIDLTDGGGFSSVGVWIVGEATDVPAIARLGPDPAGPSFTRGDLDRAVSGRRKQLKALLQDQETFAGIGNAYSDEILNLAELSPVVHASTLTHLEQDRLFDAMRATVMGAIDARRGIPLTELKAAKVAAMRVHGRAGEACVNCGDVIRDFTFSGASAQYSPGCQTDGVLL